MLLYHDIAATLQPTFARQLAWLKERWTFVTPARFEAMILGAEPIVGSNLLLTFDDGFASNRAVADEVLQPLGIRAIFFVVSDFVGLSEPAAARRFIERNVFPNYSAADIPQHLRPMDWDDLDALIAHGHTIGAHTRTHARLSAISSDAQLNDEIIASADALEQRLQTRIAHFAHTFGDEQSFSDRTVAIAKRRFRFIYTGLRGDNTGGVSPFALRRDAITPADSNSLVGAFVEGLADFHYPAPVRAPQTVGHEV